MTYKVFLTDSAYFDIDSIKQYIALNNLEASKRYVEKIYDKLEILESFPRIGKQISNSFFDYANCLYFPVINHIVFYQINEVAKCIYILRILSHFQDWKNIINKDLIKKYKTIISNQNIIIAHFNPSMVYDVYQNSLDEDNRKYVPDEVFETLEEANDVTNAIIDSYSSKTGPFVYAVIRKIDNANLGYVQIVRIKDGWEIGYHIAKRYTGNGYATEAVKLFLNYITQIEK